MKDTRILTEGAILASLYTVLLLITLYVPFISVITLWALPLPFVIFVVRRGLKQGVILGLVALLLTFIVGGIVSLPATLIFGTAGLVVGELYRRHYSGFSVLLGAGIVYIIHMLITYLSLILIVEIDPMKSSIDLMKSQLETTKSMLGSFGQSPEQIEKTMVLLDQLVYLTPLMLVGVSIILAIVTVVFSTYILKRLGHDVKGLPPFREWKFPRSLLWYYLIVLIIAMIGVEEGSLFYVAIWNLFPLLEIILTIQGFSFIFYYCYEKKMSTALPVISVIIGIIITPMLNIVRILGIIDLGFDLRKRVTSLRK